MTSRRMIWLLAAALVAGLMGGVLWPRPPAAPVSDHEAAWALPPLNDLQRHVAQDYDAIIRLMQWNANEAPASEEAATIRWRLAGIITDGVPLILVMTPEQPNTAQRIHIGEPLPDESVLEAVEHDQALIRRGECITTWHLFHPQPIATSEGCQTTEPQIQGTSP